MICYDYTPAWEKMAVAESGRKQNYGWVSVLLDPVVCERARCLRSKYSWRQQLALQRVHTAPGNFILGRYEWLDQTQWSVTVQAPESPLPASPRQKGVLCPF